MKKIVIYQLIVIALVVCAWAQGPLGNIPDWLSDYELAIKCMLIGTLGGVLYGLRGIYTNYSAHKNWDSDWEIWYFIRPIASCISGFVAYIFLRAGIVILEASQSEDSSNYGYLAFAFIAGLNVDKFLKKIENLAKVSFGIESSRASEKDE